jgi:hypothetical protein
MIVADLPGDVVGRVREYVRPCDLFRCNVDGFSGVYRDIRQDMMSKDAYVRFLIRNDMHFVFGLYVRNSPLIYGRRSIYEYGKTRYRGFVEFMNEYCIQNRSQRCREIVRPLALDS